MIHVIATITANPGQRGEVLKLLRANTPKVLAERGCIQYDAAIDRNGAGSFQTEVGPDTFVCVERWESLDALKAHIAAPHMIAYAADTKLLVARRVIQVLDPI